MPSRGYFMRGETQFVGPSPRLPFLAPAMATKAPPGKADATSDRTVAAISADDCTGCGICISACAEEAIAVDDIAVIDTERCTGCGVCAAECPNKAISLVEPNTIQQRKAAG
jgi:Pyruvate/2-oxoacid:ferredoxin oxidoreductase delta subunit